MSDACQCNACVSKRAPTKDGITSSGILASEKLGPKQSLTPNGFLLCEEVPIARIGLQDYAAIELPDVEDKDGVVQVERHEDDVFDPESMASFEGVPVTVEHPNDPVTPSNWIVYAKGIAFNIRRGEGEMSDFLLADLLVMDRGAIHDVQTKRLREISNGYDATYKQIAPGRARQTSIVGNHVALLSGSARCGEACSVQDSKPSLGDFPMAVKNGADSLRDKLRKLFMTRDSDAFEKTLSEEVKDEDGTEKNVPDIHIHMPGAEKTGGDETKDDEPADPMAKVMTVLDGLAQSVSSIGERLAKLEGGTKDSDEEKKDETKDDVPADEDDPDADPDTNDSEPDDKDDKDDKKSTKDSASFKDEFQDAKARAEILAPGVKLPTFDAKLDAKKTADAICVLRRRALRTALTNDNASLVKSIVGDADVAKMPCGMAAMAFNAASELVKQKNMASKTATADAKPEPKKDLNQIHAEFWSNRK